jgi:hypothetical protein
MRILLLMVTMAGCVGHTGLRFPGPTAKVGSERVAYAPPEKEEVEHVEPASRGTRMGRKVARAAESFLGKKRMIVDGDKQRYDCSGMVCAAHKKAGLPMRGSSRTLFEQSQDMGVFHKRKRPDVGDIAFFDNTWDRNKNGRRDDQLTHVAIVETVERDGTITLIHLGGSGITRLTMNMRHPSRKTSADGKKWNNVLRKGNKGAVLTGELCRGFGSLWSVQEKRVASR